MTQEGYDRLTRELETLTGMRRAELAARLREARTDGGNPAENGELMQAMQEGQLLDRRIRALEARLAAVRVAEPAPGDGVVEVGTRVRLRGQGGGIAQYDIVGKGEADPVLGRISVGSPVGQAVHGRRAGESFEVTTPTGRHRFDVVAIELSRPHLAQAA